MAISLTEQLESDIKEYLHKIFGTYLSCLDERFAVDIKDEVISSSDFNYGFYNDADISIAFQRVTLGRMGHPEWKIYNSCMDTEANTMKQNAKVNTPIHIRPASPEEAGLFYSELEENEDKTIGAVGRVTYASGEQMKFTDASTFLQSIRKELPYMATTGFRYELLTDDPEIRKAVDDILLGFAGDENQRRAYNYGLTEKGIKGMQNAADPTLPHTYTWFVITDCNTSREHIFRDLTFEEAIRTYQDSDRPEKRIGVTKDGIATVDLVRCLDGEQQFFTDHLKLDSFKDDTEVTAAAETLRLELDQNTPQQGMAMGGLS